MSIIDQNLMDTFSFFATYLSYGIGGLGVLIYLVHLLKLLFTKEFKVKYDYINMFEIKLMWYSTVLLIVGIAIYINAYQTSLELLWIGVKLFITVMFSLITGVIIQNVLKFYYPFYIEKRLKRLRYTPRTSPDGIKMRLLSEEEEDVYLDEGMQAEENAFSIDYDVWIDEDSGYTKIEKYNGRLHALKCSECNYQTLRVSSEDVGHTPTTTEEGELTKHFTCGYCGHKEKKTFKIARLQENVDEES